MDFFCFIFAMLLSLIPNLIASILSFIFFLFGVGIWLFFNISDVLGFVFILVYIGAIAVLFIFVTMLIHFFENVSFQNSYSTKTTQNLTYTENNMQAGSILLASIDTSFILSDILSEDYDVFYNCLLIEESLSSTYEIYSSSDIFILSSILFTFYFPSFLVISMILLITTVGIFFILFQKTR